MTDDKPVSQGEALKNHLQPLKLGTVANRIGIAAIYLSDIAEGHKPMSARVAWLIEQHFPGKTATEWLAMGRNPDRRLQQLTEIRQREIGGNLNEPTM